MLDATSVARKVKVWSLEYSVRRGGQRNGFSLDPFGTPT